MDTTVIYNGDAVLQCFIASPEQHELIDRFTCLLSGYAGLTPCIALACIIAVSSDLLHKDKMIMSDMMKMPELWCVMFFSSVCREISRNFGVPGITGWEFMRKVIHEYDEWRKKYDRLFTNSFIRIQEKKNNE